MSDTLRKESVPIIDAYMHVGSPRFGTAEQALAACDLWGVHAAVLVLGPRVPDIAALHSAQTLRPDRVRTIGIPYGDTAEQRLVSADACLEAGAIGIRLQGNEPIDNPAVMARLGEAGLWAYATDPLHSPRHTALLLDWLARYPAARIGAPHFVSPDLALLDTPLAEGLVRHPRFHAILSRQGQKGSREAYPFGDLRPWVERVLAWCGAERVLWGSEYPVIYWRGEQIDQTRRWLLDLQVDLPDGAYTAISGGNAQELFFASPAPSATIRELPNWLQAYPQPGPVPLEPTASVDLPMDVYEPLFDDYVQCNSPDAPLTFSDYCVRQLCERAMALRQGAGSARCPHKGEATT